MPDLKAINEPRPSQSCVAAHVAPTIPCPSLTAADVAAARALGHEEGRLAATDEARVRATAALQQVADALKGSADQDAALVEQAASRLAELLAQAIAIAFPELEEKLGPRATARLFGRLLPGLMAMPAIEVRASPNAVQAIRGDLTSLPRDQIDRIVLHVDETFKDGDIHIAWRDGEARRNGAAVHSEIVAAIAAIATETSDGGGNS